MKNQEVYEAVFDGALHVRGCGRELLARAEEDGIEPVCTLGDPGLLSCSVFRFPGGGGFVAVRDGAGDAVFKVFCATSLALAEAASHYASLAANLRYGADIFEDAGVE